MRVEEIKEELKGLETPAIEELGAYILLLRRTLDGERKDRIADILDSADGKWLSLDEEHRLGNG